MKYDVVIKGTIECDDDMEPDVDDLADSLSNEVDTTDVEVDVDTDDDTVTLTYTLSVTDVELTPLAE